MVSGAAAGAAPPAAPAEPAALRTGGPGSSRASRWWHLLPPGVTLGITLWGITGASFWRDEAATLSAIRRPLPVLCRMLVHTDAVHALYYLLMWPLARVLGTGELGMRLPSAVAMSAAAAVITAIGRRLVSVRAGMAAGLAFAFLPVTSRYGQEARSYAMVMALAALASYLLIRADDAGARRWRWLTGYSLTVAALGWANLLSLLIVPAHATTLVTSARDRRGRAAGHPAPVRPAAWLAAAGAAGIIAAPLWVLAWPQRHGTARFLTPTTWTALGGMPSRMSGSWLVLAAAIPLIAAGMRTPGAPRAALVRLCLPWLLLPPAVLLGTGLVMPVYNPRYILFCVPAFALLAGSGIDAMATRGEIRKIQG